MLLVQILETVIDHLVGEERRRLEDLWTQS